MTIKIAMIAGVAENGVIGSHQTIPWRIPSDFAWFKQTTMGTRAPIQLLASFDARKTHCHGAQAI